jgi:hypothetical protein
VREVKKSLERIFTARLSSFFSLFERKKKEHPAPTKLQKLAAA